MNEEQAAPNQKEEPQKPEPVKRNFIINNPPSYEQKSAGRGLGKKLLVLTAATVLLLGGVYLVNKRFQASSELSGTVQPAPAATAESESAPAPSVRPVLDRLKWSLEILNGSGVTGAARKTADKVQSLGYPVVRTGNADRQTYDKTELWVKKELADQAELVIADLKDAVKIASAAGELRDSTASARIIIGKDSI